MESPGFLVCRMDPWKAPPAWELNMSQTGNSKMKVDVCISPRNKDLQTS